MEPKRSKGEESVRCIKWAVPRRNRVAGEKEEGPRCLGGGWDRGASKARPACPRPAARGRRMAWPVARTRAAAPGLRVIGNRPEHVTAMDTLGKAG